MIDAREHAVFFVKLIVQNGKAIGHAVSDTRDFPNISEAHNADIEKPHSTLDDKLDHHLSSFVDSMTVYTEFMPVVLQAVPAFTGEIFKASMESFLQNNASKVDPVDDGKIFTVNVEHQPDYMALAENTKPAFDVMTSLTRNVLMGLIALLDQHIRDAMRISLNANPAWLEKAHSTMTLEEIFGFEDLEALRERAIETEVEKLSLEGRNEQIMWFEKKFNIDPINKNYINWSLLMEICERRNLFAHTNGYVSKQYIERAKTHKYNVSNIEIGSKLTVDEAYYEEAVNCIFEFGVMLSHVICKKIMKAESSNADERLSDLGLSLIKRGKYELAVRVLKFAYEARGVANERIRKMLAVNYASALKLKNQSEEALKLLDEVDWSATGVDFQICVAAIRGDENLVSNLMNRAKEHGLDANAFREWPVFFEVRDKEVFKSAYKEIFGYPYSAGPRKRDAFSEFFKHLRKDEGRVAEGEIFAERDAMSIQNVKD